MIWLVALTFGIVITVGLYLAMSRDLLRCAIGFSMAGSGVNLLVYSAGRLINGVPPIVDGESLVGVAANPVPQAMVLTAIVISFSLTCFSLLLILCLRQSGKTTDITHLDAAEPAAKDPQKPAIEDPA